jgi:uncharacterized membrane protein YhfC
LNYLILTYALNGILMIALPIGLAIFLVKKWKMGWQTWWVGVVTFILSQVGHIPFNWGVDALLDRTGIIFWPMAAQQVFSAVFLGLSAGIFEETARYLVLRFWLKKARSWRNGVLFGAGHGGAEATILGILVLTSFVSMLVVRNMNLAEVLPAAQIETAGQQIAAYWSVPWYDSLMGALERLFTLPVQIALAVLVMQVFTRKNILWLVYAILFHALIDGCAVFLAPHLGVYWTEALLGTFSVISLLIIFLLKKPEPESPVIVVPESKITVLNPVEETQENLDATRYQD